MASPSGRGKPSSFLSFLSSLFCSRLIVLRASCVDRARRLPRVLPLDWQDPLVQDFIIWSTRLRWQCLYNELLEPNVVRDVYQNQCSRLQTPVRDPPHLAHKDREAQVQDLLLRYGKHRPLTFQPQDFDKVEMPLSLRDRKEMRQIVIYSLTGL